MTKLLSELLTELSNEISEVINGYIIDFSVQNSRINILFVHNEIKYAATGLSINDVKQDVIRKIQNEQQ